MIPVKSLRLQYLRKTERRIRAQARRKTHQSRLFKRIGRRDTANEI